MSCGLFQNESLKIQILHNLQMHHLYLVVGEDISLTCDAHSVFTGIAQMELDGPQSK